MDNKKNPVFTTEVIFLNIFANNLNLTEFKTKNTEMDKQVRDMK
jgi:hypothetical protein